MVATYTQYRWCYQLSNFECLNTNAKAGKGYEYYKYLPKNLIRQPYNFIKNKLGAL